jgi:hypothetical protein
MIATLALSALAAPPRAEVLAGWSGNAVTRYAYTTAQPALLRGDWGSLLVRGTVSQLHVRAGADDDATRIEAPGLSLGPAVVLTPGEVAVVLGVALSARRADTFVEDTLTDSRVTVDAAVTGDLYWRPGGRASLYTQGSLAAAGRSVWARAGATAPVTPRDRPVSLWLGLEGTSSGPLPTLATEVGPVAEIPLQPLRVSLALRAAAPVAELAAGTFALRDTNLGVSAYWAW